jgi:hypothetical protein
MTSTYYWRQRSEQLRDHFDGTEDGPAKRLGVTRDQWRKLIPEILDAVYPIAHEQGVRYAEYMREREIK